MPWTEIQDWLASLGLTVSIADLETLAEENEAEAELLATLILLNYVEQGLASAVKLTTPATPTATAPASPPLAGITATALLALASASYKADLALQSTARSAYGAGAWASAQAEPAVEYLIYKTVGDNRVRDSHKAIGGTCLPKTHSWWLTHYPPNGYRCRCRALPATREQAEKHGISEQPPDELQVDYENEATGERLTLPASIQPGWQFNPQGRKEQLEKLIAESVERFKAFKQIK